MIKIIVSSILRMYSKLKGRCVAPGHFVPGDITQATVYLDQCNHLIIMVKSYRLVRDFKILKLLNSYFLKTSSSVLRRDKVRTKM